MNPAESTECMTTLAELFPQSDLTDGELRLFQGQLHKFSREEVIDSMRTSRLRSRFNRPNFAEILDRCRVDSNAIVQRDRPAPKYATIIAQEVARANPHLFGRSEAELILRYHRFWWARYVAGAKQRLDRWMNLDFDAYVERRAKSRGVDPLDEDAMAELRAVAKQVQDNELESIPAAIDRNLEAMQATCSRDLMAAGLEEAAARSASGFITCLPHEFDLCIDDLAVTAMAGAA